MSDLIDVRVPDMGNFKDVAVIDVLVKPGDTVDAEAPLLTLETEKATMDVPSSAAGVVESVHVSKGGRVNAGDVIASLRAAQAVPAAETAQMAPMARMAPKAQTAQTAQTVQPPAATSK